MAETQTSASDGSVREMMQHGVVGLRRSGSPDQVEGVAPEKVREPLPCAGNGRVRTAADAMGTGGIANESLRRFQPGLPRLRQHRCCGVVVEVNHRCSFGASITT